MQAITLADAPVGFYTNESMLRLKMTTPSNQYEGMLRGSTCIFYTTDPISQEEHYCECLVAYVSFETASKERFLKGKIRFSMATGNGFYLTETHDVYVGIATDANDDSIFIAMPTHFYEQQKHRLNELMRPGIKGRRVGHLTVVG